MANITFRLRLEVDGVMSQDEAADEIDHYILEDNVAEGTLPSELGTITIDQKELDPLELRGHLLDALETAACDAKACQEALWAALALLGDEHVRWANEMLDEANNPQQQKD
jgi:hypothetical protein